MPIIPISGSAAARGALVPIASWRGDDVNGEIAFSNIPQIYQDLMVVINSMATTSATAFAYTYYTLYGTGLSYTQLVANGSTITSNRFVGAGSIMPYASTYLNNVYPTCAIAHILNYRSTTSVKQVIQRSAQNVNGSGNTAVWAGMIQSNSPVTLVDVATFAAGGVFSSGTTITLYGVRSVGQ